MSTSCIPRTLTHTIVCNSGRACASKMYCTLHSSAGGNDNIDDDDGCLLTYMCWTAPSWPNRIRFRCSETRKYLRVQWNSQTVLNWSNKIIIIIVIMIRICYTCLCVRLQRREHSYWLLCYARSCELIRFSFCALISAISVRYKHVSNILFYQISVAGTCFLFRTQKQFSLSLAGYSFSGLFGAEMSSMELKAVDCIRSFSGWKLDRMHDATHHFHFELNVHYSWMITKQPKKYEHTPPNVWEHCSLAPLPTSSSTTIE